MGHGKQHTHGHEHPLYLCYHGTMMTTIMFMMTISMFMTTKLMEMKLMFRLEKCFRMLYISMFTILFTKIVPSRLDTLVRWNYKIMVVFFCFFFLSFFIIIFSIFFFFFCISI